MHILYRQVNGFPLIFSSWVHRGETAASSPFLSFILHIIFWNFGVVSIMLEAFYLITSYRGNASPLKNLTFPSLNLIRTCDLEDEEALSRWRVVPGRGNEIDWWRRNWKSPEEEKASPEVLDSRADVQQMALELAWGVCWLPRHVVCVITVPHVPKGSRTGLMLCCHYRDFVNTVWASRGFAFSSCTGSHRLCSLSCLGVKSSSVTYQLGSPREIPWSFWDSVSASIKWRA